MTEIAVPRTATRGAPAAPFPRWVRARYWYRCTGTGTEKINLLLFLRTLNFYVLIVTTSLATSLQSYYSRLCTRTDSYRT